jgi:hypothetical protein
MLFIFVHPSLLMFKLVQRILPRTLDSGCGVGITRDVATEIS